MNALLAHWRVFGLPAYAQFDNDNVFQGPHHLRDVMGRVTRLCLSLGVTPVFTPPRETGFQASIENFNGRWQLKVWARFHFGTSRRALLSQSDKFLRALRQRTAERIASAPPRKPIPENWCFDLREITPGVIIYLRRTDDKGQVQLLGHTFDVDGKWVYRLVRAEVDLKRHCIRFYALRRRAPNDQPLLRTTPHRMTQRALFRE